MLKCFLITAALTSTLAAQIYDNGPLETASLPGFSDLQNTSHLLTVYGYGGQSSATINNICYDEFCVDSAMVIDEVEIYCYQTGAGNGPSTITGAFIAFFDTDPSTQTFPPTPMAGSPLMTDDQFLTPSNPVSNAWSGLFRSLNGNGATNRAIMAVRVKLEDALGNATPMILFPGTYWLGRQASGSLTSGPWLPPIHCENQQTTGNAMQSVTAGTWNNPIVSGGTFSQGMPFKLYGPASTTPGTITNVATNTHGLGITVCGAPNVGGFIRTEVQNAAGLTIIGFDFSANVTSFCSTNFVHAFPLQILALESDLQIPQDCSFNGLVIGIQAADLVTAGGGCLGVVNVSDGYRVKLSTN